MQGEGLQGQGLDLPPLSVHEDVLKYGEGGWFVSAEAYRWAAAGQRL